jgi:hypothetical protein
LAIDTGTGDNQPIGVGWAELRRPQRRAAADPVEHGSHSGVPPNWEAMMANKPKAIEAAEEIARHNPALVLGLTCRATDPAVGGFEHTEFFLELDKPTQNNVMAAKLEAEGAVHKALADGHTQIASILKSRG